MIQGNVTIIGMDLEVDVDEETEEIIQTGTIIDVGTITPNTADDVGMMMKSSM